MRRVLIETLCSPCYHLEQAEVDAEGIVLAIGRAEPKVLDLCSEHKESATLATLLEWLHEWGMDPSEVMDAESVESALLCPHPGCRRARSPLKTEAALERHLARVHG